MGMSYGPRRGIARRCNIWIEGSSARDGVRDIRRGIRNVGKNITPFFCTLRAIIKLTLYTILLDMLAMV
jgi:hypothetical protein